MSSDKKCYAAMVDYWTSDEYKKKHEDGQIHRAVMDGGSHCQGSLPLEVSRRREVSTAILYSCFRRYSLLRMPPSLIFMLSLLQAKKTGVDPNFFDYWELKRTMKKPHPKTGSMWVNKGAEMRSTKFVDKFKEVHGADADPRTAPFDPEVAVLAGEGARNGRLWIGDGSIDPMTIPSLSQLRKGRTSSQPAIETRPRLGVITMDEIRVCSFFSPIYTPFHIFCCNNHDRTNGTT